jgi:hypothetical protein
LKNTNNINKKIYINIIIREAKVTRKNLLLLIFFRDIKIDIVFYTKNRDNGSLSVFINTSTIYKNYHLKPFSSLRKKKNDRLLS